MGFAFDFSIIGSFIATGCSCTHLIDKYSSSSATFGSSKDSCPRDELLSLEARRFKSLTSCINESELFLKSGIGLISYEVKLSFFTLPELDLSACLCFVRGLLGLLIFSSTVGTFFWTDDGLPLFCQISS